MSEEVNPYPEGSQQYQEWQREWERQQDEKEAAARTTGATGSDVPEELWRGRNA